MYYIRVTCGPSLLIESTDSMIIYIAIHKYFKKLKKKVGMPVKKKNIYIYIYIYQTRVVVTEN